MTTPVFEDSYRRMPNGVLCSKRRCRFPTPSCRADVGFCDGKTDAQYAAWRAQHEDSVRRRAEEAEQTALDEQRLRDRRDIAISAMLSQFDLTADDLREFVREAAGRP